MSSTTTTNSRLASWTGPVSGILRILVGFTFFWSFIDKLFGLGFATPSERAWINGGSPTTGYLTMAVPEGNPFTGVWTALANINPATDILFMAGLLGIGLALMLGIGSKIATISGVLMYFFMYLASMPFTTNPIIDEHLTMAFVVLLLFAVRASDHIGFGRPWAKLVGEKSILR